MVGVQMLGAYGSLEVFVHQSNVRLHSEEELRLQAVPALIRMVALVAGVADCLRRVIQVSISSMLMWTMCFLAVSMPWVVCVFAYHLPSSKPTLLFLSS